MIIRVSTASLLVASLLTAACGGDDGGDVTATFRFADGHQVAYSGSVKLELRGDRCTCKSSVDGDGLGVTVSWLAQPLPNGDEQTALGVHVGGDTYVANGSQFSVSAMPAGFDIMFELATVNAPPGSRPLSRELTSVTNGSMLCPGDAAACRD